MLTKILTALLFFTILAAATFSCASESSVTVVDSAAAYTRSDSVNGIRFEVFAQQSANRDAPVAVTCSLFNDNSDTAYFMTSSCAGEAYSLQYDTALFWLSPSINCNASWPCLKKIAPNDTLVFETWFGNRKNKTAIKLGYDFFKVKSTFNAETLTLADVHHRPVENRTIVWAREVKIERITPEVK